MVLKPCLSYTVEFWASLGYGVRPYLKKRRGRKMKRKKGEVGGEGGAD
jgi:hypothetical protein